MTFNNLFNPESIYPLTAATIKTYMKYPEDHSGQKAGEVSILEGFSLIDKSNALEYDNKPGS